MSDNNQREALAVAISADWQDSRAVAALIRRIETVLTPDLLNGKYADNSRYQKLNPTTGHCSVAAEALWYMIGNWKTPFRDHWAYDTPEARARQAAGEPRASKDETHHWLQIPGTLPEQAGSIYDPTADQYLKQVQTDGRVLSVDPPYEHGTAAGFQTNVPSKRAQAVIDRLANSLLRSPLPGVKVHERLIRLPEASPRLAYREQDYRAQAQFYAGQKIVAAAAPLPRRGRETRTGQHHVGTRPSLGRMAAA
jgi:hypothetical protein